MLLIPTHYRVDDASVAWRVADDEAVLLHADSSEYFGLNQTGTLLWAHLAEHPMTLAQLTTWAGKTFPNAPAGIGGEISAFIDELLEHKLIETVDSAAGAAPGTKAEATDRKGTPSWDAPTVQRFGELEKLILSGE